MKNEQKYKTVDERIKAFDEWRRKIKCEGCSQLCDTCKAGPSADVCGFKWLSLEADDEKIESCPFCGAECRVESDAFLANVTCNSDSCFYKSGEFRTREEAIAAHNRVARAVRYAGESEAK